MRRLRFALSTLSPVVLLMACAPPSDIPPVAPLPPENACGASEYQSLIGTAVDATQFDGHDQLRIIPPGTAVTMDYRPTRLNVETDKSGIITRVYCG